MSAMQIMCVGKSSRVLKGLCETERFQKDIDVNAISLQDINNPQFESHNYTSILYLSGVTNTSVAQKDYRELLKVNCYKLCEFVITNLNGRDLPVIYLSSVKCKTCNETWITSVNNRTQKRSKCPYCSLANTSFGEQIIYEFFKIRYSSTLNRHKYSGYEFDISIPELNTYIEYGSDYYHFGREQRDLEKRQLCEKNNKRFIQVMQIAYKTVDIINNENNDIIYVGSDINKQSNIIILLNRLCNILDIKEVNKNEIEEVYDKVMNKYKQSREIVKSGNHS